MKSRCLGSKIRYEILAVIPARAGSKGILEKNIRKLCGVPLVAYTINAAKKSRLISRIIVSTDDKKTAKICLGLGAEVPFLRPKRLALDSTPTLPVIRHTLDYLGRRQGYQPDIVVILQPTSPLRTAKIIDDALMTFLKGGYDSLVSLKEVEESPYWMKTMRSGFLYPFLKGSQRYYQRQRLPELFILNGALFICRAELIKKKNPFIGKRVGGYIMDKTTSLDIDDALDFTQAEILLYRRKFCKRLK